MTVRLCPGLKRLAQFRFSAIALLLLLASSAATGQTTILFLRNGDRIAGKIDSEDTNRVTITTTWAKGLVVPTVEIVRREILSPQKPVTNLLASGSLPIVPRLGLMTSRASNAPPKHWKGEVRLGADYLYGATDQEIYYGRVKFSYERPYRDNPKEFFRSYLDYSVDYGWTKTPGSGTNASSSVVSADRMYGSDKTDFDIGKRWYVYDLAGVGYDRVLKIDLQYEVGPGMGYHVFTRTNFTANLESGIDYQAQYRSDNTTTKAVFVRLAEDLTLQLNKSLKLTEKFEFFPRTDASEYRARAESTLSYGLWRNISFNLSLLDLYDTQPAAGVPNNNLQVHSSLGITF